MNTPTTEKIEASRQALRGFGRHYDYDVTYLEELMDASPAAFQAFEAAMPLGQFQQAAPIDLLSIAKIAAMRAQDCGPCTELGVKKAREAGVSDPIIRGALHGGQGLSAEHRDIHDYARGVALNEELDPALLPRITARWGREIVAELAVNIVGMRLYPTLKRALGHARSCSLIAALA